MIWEYGLLWKKAQSYAALALEQDRESELFPLWSTFALEFLARATLAYVHPGLLADPRSGEHLLYAHGFGSPNLPMSIPVKSVFDRCRVIVPEFTEDDQKRCMALVERRNAELHSGEVAFASYPTGMWLAHYFKACATLVSFQKKTLEELLGADEAKAAAEMIAAAKAEVLKEVKTRIAAAVKAFAELPPDQVASAKSVQVHAPSGSLRRKCLACGSDGILSGKVISASEPKLGDGVIYRELHVLPTSFACGICGLSLNNHDELHATEMGGQFTVTSQEDPAEFFGLAYIEEDYGND